MINGMVADTSEAEDYIINAVLKNDRKWHEPYRMLLERIGMVKDSIELHVYDEVIKNLAYLLMLDKKENSYGQCLVGAISKYNEFISKVVELLQNTGTKEDKDREYIFVVFSGFARDAGVLPLIPSKERTNIHIFLIECPEEKIFKPHQLKIVLCHEIAHYVGADIRSRDDRLDEMKKLCCRLITLGIKTSLLNMSTDELKINSEDSPAWDKVERNLHPMVEWYFNRNFDEKYVNATSKWEKEQYTDKGVKDSVQYNQANKKHMRFVKAQLLVSINDMLHNSGQILFEPVFMECFNDISYSKREEMLQLSFEQVTRITSEKNAVFSIGAALNIIEYILKEAYADLCSIMILGLSLEEYIDCIVTLYSDTNNKGHGIKVITRVAVVIYVMTDSDNIYLNNWTDENTRELARRETKSGHFVKNVHEFMYLFMTKNNNSKDERISQLSTAVHLVLTDYFVLRQIVTYLLKCKRKMIDSFGERENLTKELRSYFDNSTM